MISDRLKRYIRQRHDGAWSIDLIVYTICAGLSLTLCLFRLLYIHTNLFPVDFVAFWSAAHLSITGQASNIYDVTSMFLAERAAEPHLSEPIVFPYPPTYLLPNAALALANYQDGYWISMAFTTLAFWLVFIVILRQNVCLKPRHQLILCIGLLAFTPFWENYNNGHNGLLTSAIAAVAILNLQHRPILAGISIGLLVIKPHLGILFPFALIAGRMWKPFFAAALTVTVLVVASYLAFGSQTWLAYLHTLHVQNLGHFIESVQSHHWTPTVFSLVFEMTGSQTLAYELHFFGMTVAIISTIIVWRRTENSRVRGATLMTATLLMSPHVGIYDLVWLAFPLVWLFIDLIENPGPAWQKKVLGWVWFLIVWFMAIGPAIGYYYVSLFEFGLIALTICRAYCTDTQPT